MATFTYLLHLEKVCKKIHFKKYCLVEQSLCELEIKETKVTKMGSIPTAVEIIDILEMVSSVSEVY